MISTILLKLLKRVSDSIREYIYKYETATLSQINKKNSV